MSSMFPKAVDITEGAARDGLQQENALMPTERKIALIKAFAAAGARGSRPPAHELRRLDVDIGFGERKLHALIGPDGPVKDDPLARVSRGGVRKPFAIAN